MAAGDGGHAEPDAGTGAVGGGVRLASAGDAHYPESIPVTLATALDRIRLRVETMRDDEGMTDVLDPILERCPELTRARAVAAFVAAKMAVLARPGRPLW